MIMPFTTYITPKRLIGLAAVTACSVSAGTIPSSSGSANVAPMPRSIVRRGIAFLVMIMPMLLLRTAARPAFERRRGARTHPERCAFDDGHDDGGPAVIF